MRTAYDTYEGWERCIEGFGEETWDRDRALVRPRRGLIWLSIGSGETGNGPFGPKIMGISFLAEELLASEYELWSMELIIT